MLLSMKWLSDYVDISDISIKDFCEKMTMSGFKVESYRVESEEIKNVVVGKIISISKHENADRLLVCKVDVGGKNLLQIVTAAKNIFEEALVPVALHGSQISGGVSIKKGKLRGVTSEGMLCSLSELGLTLSDFPESIEDGIFIIRDECEVGQDIRDVLGLNDIIVDFEITYNRADCLSIVGLAREVAAVFKRPLKIFSDYKVEKTKSEDDIININVVDKDLCRRYMAKVVNNIKIKPSPRWIRERLRSSGVRAINNIVDITNYVMLEYGQPIHAFDCDKIKGQNIIVRKSCSGETINLLDGSKRELDNDMLIIADECEPLAIAGIMGGNSSGISEKTRSVIFEVANFNQESVRQTSKKLSIKSESSIRFERGVSNYLSEIVINRICELIDILDAGELVSGLVDINSIKDQFCEIDLDYSFINNILSFNLSNVEIDNILSRLFIKVIDNKAVIPSWRSDITGLADIAEEVARIYGYDNIVVRNCNLPINPIAMKSDRQKFDDDIIDFIASQGYYEVKTFSFVGRKFYDKINLQEDNNLKKCVSILNPLGENSSIMRTTATPSMLEVISKNYNNRNLDCKFFELAKEYIPRSDGELPLEINKLVLGLYGKKCDFYDLKGVVEDLFDWLNLEKSIFISQHDDLTFHSGRCADIFINNSKVGIIGQINPLVLDNYQISSNVFIANINIDMMFENKISNKLYIPISKFPSANRDLSLICDRDLCVGEIENVIKQFIGSNLEDICLSDIYMGEQIEKSKKSVCYSLKLKNFEKTLTDNEIDIIINGVLEKLKNIKVYLRQI